MLVGLLVTVVAAPAAGCASRTDDYCATLRDDRSALARLSRGAGGPGNDAVSRTLTIFGQLRSRAPEDVVDEWDTTFYAWQTLTSALRRAGAPAGAYRPGHRPTGVSAREARDVRQAAEELRSPRVRDAAREIEQQARDVCGVDLGL